MLYCVQLHNYIGILWWQCYYRKYPIQLKYQVVSYVESETYEIGRFTRNVIMIVMMSCKFIPNEHMFIIYVECKQILLEWTKILPVTCQKLIQLKIGVSKSYVPMLDSSLLYMMQAVNQLTPMCHKWLKFNKFK